MSSHLLDSCTSLNEGSSPGILQEQGLDEVTASLEHFSLAETSLRDEVQNTVQSDIVQESTGKQLLTGTHDDRSFLREQLKSLECPFTWNLQNINVRDTLDSTISRLNEKVEEIEEDTFQWRRFNLMLVLCYQHFCRGETAVSLAKQRICEQILNPTEPKGEYESFFHATRNALLHVMNACKCHLLFETGVLNEARHIFQKVYKYGEMDNPCKAAIWGIRAAVLMEYGYEGTKAAIEYSKKAVELDPQQGEWHFLFGKSLGRIRRIESYMEIPAQEEIKALEKAVELTKNPSFIIFLAQAYREVSFRVYSLHRNELALFREKLGRMNARSLELYKEALKLRGDCAHINIRCAQGFSKLAYQYRDLELAKECCAKALALAPNNAMANHVAGNIYERYDNDVERAKKHYQIAGEQGAYGAYMDLYRLKYSEDSTFDPIPEFELLLRRFTEKPLAEEILLQMGSYYLFIKDDLTTAYRQYWSKVISENPDSEKLKNQKFFFVNTREPLNIYELIFDEARLRLRNTNRSLSNDDQDLLRHIVFKYSKLLPELLEILQNPDARWLWMKQPVKTRVDHASSVVVVEAEEDRVDVVGVGVEVTVIEGTGARVKQILEVGVVVEISMATTADTEVVIQALRVGVAIGVAFTAELEVVIQALKVGVAVGVAFTRELEVVIQALRVGMDNTAKKEILAAVGDKEEIQVLMAGAPRIRTGEVGQEVLIKLENKS